MGAGRMTEARGTHRKGVGLCPQPTGKHLPGSTQFLMKISVVIQRLRPLDKKSYISHIDQLFGNMQSRGILLLNAGLVLGEHNVNKEAKYWQPFMSNVLKTLASNNQAITLILFGKVAKLIESLPESPDRFTYS